MDDHMRAACVELTLDYMRRTGQFDVKGVMLAVWLDLFHILIADHDFEPIDLIRMVLRED